MSKSKRAEQSASVVPTAAPREPEWVGWVYALDGIDGYRRRKVRIPASWLDEMAVGPASGPDLRGTVVMNTMADSMTDAFMIELSQAARGE